MTNFWAHQPHDHVSEQTQQQNQRLGLVLVMVVLGMVGISFLSVPLYAWFCQVTGWSGTPGKFAAGDRIQDSAVVYDRPFTVQFDSNINSALPWQFEAVARDMTADLGQQYVAYYRATNTSPNVTTGTATFNVTPLKLGQYFVKIDCFCFTEQTLQPGETVDMPVSFYIDPAIMQDPMLDDIQKITLSYTFFPLQD